MRPTAPGGPASSPRRRPWPRRASRRRRRQPGQVGDHRLEVEQRLEPALADLGLVGRVGGVPGRVLQHVALDDRRGDRAVVPQPDHRGVDVVGGGPFAQLRQGGGLVDGGRQVQRRPVAHALGHAGVGELRERGVADDGQHLGGLAVARPDVPAGERTRRVQCVQ